MLLLHGGAGSWNHWRRNVDALAATHALWIPDLPGLGDSALPPQPRDHEAIAGVLALDIDELIAQPAPMHLVGFSFGALVAGALAGLRRARFRQLVIVGAGGLGLRPPGERILKGWRHLKDDAAVAEAHRFNLAALMLSDPARIDDDTLGRYTADVRRARVNSARISRTADLKRTLVALGMPVHGIWGRKDVTAHGRFDDIRDILRAAHPQAELHVIEDAGHWVQHEQAGAFNAILAGLLARA